MKKKILIVVGTRPNFIKITQFKKVVENKYKDLFDVRILHTGQHFDKAMADDFFINLDIWPDYFLNIPMGSPVSQMGEIMIRIEKVFVEFKPDLVIVPGDVNSTLAAGLAAHRFGLTVAHLESGLRSFDRTMPEEINRILTDEISDIYFVTEKSGVDNLKRGNKLDSSIHFVGNTMIDTLVAFEKEIDKSKILKTKGLKEKEYILITVHRPSNVDYELGLNKVVSLIDSISKNIKVVFPVHPRTKNKLAKYNLYQKLVENKEVELSVPLDYFSFQKLIKESFCVITDSGGIQEETTFYRIPCLTVRENTERPSTIEIGTNELTSLEIDLINSKISKIRNGGFKIGEIPKYWDGFATDRIMQKLADIYF